MTSMNKNDSSTSRRWNINFDAGQFVRDNITQSWWLTLWLLLLGYLTASFAVSQLRSYPITTIIVLIVWLVSVAYTVGRELMHKHDTTSLWLRENMYNSITNVLLSLLIVLGLLAAAFGLFSYSVNTASFRRQPADVYRATLVSAGSEQACFEVGYVDDEESRLLRGAEDVCFPATAYAPDLSDDGLDVLGESVASVCFDTEPSDPENGITCFESLAGEPNFFEVSYAFSGANWGAVVANLTALMVFRFDRAELWRVWACLILVFALGVASFVVYRDSFTNKRARQALTSIWLFSPVLLYVLLRGVTPASEVPFSTVLISFVAVVVAGGVWFLQRFLDARYPPSSSDSESLRMLRILLSVVVIVASVYALISGIRLILYIFGLMSFGGESVFSPLDPDVDWGGFLLTLIITVFAIVVSFPLGVVLALGRRSDIRGIPWYITYPLTAVVVFYGLTTSTPQLLADSRNLFETIVAYWPFLVLLAAIGFQQVWNGNVVAAFSTIYIEFVRGVPLIVVLFITIILFPIFLPPDMEVLGTWRVIWGFTLFAAAYLAENVRGGLQAIPKGQYEAADSLGLSTFNKYRLIILPQAIRIVIPAITNQYIGLFKDTTLVAIVGLLDILGVANAIGAQPQWLGVRREAYLFIAILYYVICALMAGYSSRLEKRMGLGER